MYSSDELFQHSQEGYLDGYIPSCEARRETKTTNNPQVSPETVHHGSTYIIIILTWQNETMNDDKTKIFTYRPVSDSLGFRSADDVTTIADDVTMTRQLWCYHLNNGI